MSRMTKLKYLLLIPIIIFSFATVANAQRATKVKKETLVERASPYETIEAYMKMWDFNEGERGRLLASSRRIYNDARKIGGPRFAANLMRLLQVTSKRRPVSMSPYDYKYLKGLRAQWFNIMYKDKDEKQLGWIAYNVSLGPSLFAARAKFFDGRNIDPKKVLKEGKLPFVVGISSGISDAKAEAIAAKVAKVQKLGRMEDVQQGTGQGIVVQGGGRVPAGGSGGQGDCFGDGVAPIIDPLGDPSPVMYGGQEGSGGAGFSIPWLSQGDTTQVSHSPLADPCGNVTGWAVPTGLVGVKPFIGSGKTNKGHSFYVVATPKPGGKTSVFASKKDPTTGQKMTSKSTSQTKYQDGQKVTVVFSDGDSGTTNVHKPKPPAEESAEAPPAPVPAPAPAEGAGGGAAGMPLPTEVGTEGFDPDCIETVIADDNCGGGGSGDCLTLGSALSSSGIAPVASASPGMPDPNSAFLGMGDCGGGSSGFVPILQEITGGYAINWGPDGKPDTGGGGGDPCQMDPLTGFPKNPAACCEKNPSMCGSGGGHIMLEEQIIEQLQQQ